MLIKEKGMEEMDQIFDLEKMLTFFNIIFYSLVLNILFLFCNLPFLFFYFFVGIGSIGEYFPLFLLCLLPVAPALSALLHSMMKLVEYKDICPVKEYKKGYKNNWFKAIKTGTIQIIFAFILKTNIQFFKQIPQLSILAGMFMIFMLILIMMTPFIYLLIVRYDMSVLQILKATLTITIGKPVYAIANLMIAGFVFVLFELIAGTTFLFIGSLYAGLLVLSNQKLFHKLESR